MIAIRLSQPEDHNAIMFVNRLAWQAAYQDIFTAEEISRLFKGEIKQQGTWLKQRKDRLGAFVALENEQIIGFIGMAALLEEATAEITTFYVLPEHQGKGIGKQLWEAALKHLREAGYAKLWVWVLEKAEARQFYEGRGCIQKAEGIYSVGAHDEKTLGYFLELSSAE